MRSDDQERIVALCDRIAKEQDGTAFIKLVRELNDVLEKKPVTPDQKPNV